MVSRRGELLVGIYTEGAAMSDLPGLPGFGYDDLRLHDGN
jgi:hypothetical protein